MGRMEVVRWMLVYVLHLSLWDGVLRLLPWYLTKCSSICIYESCCQRSNFIVLKNTPIAASAEILRECAVRWAAFVCMYCRLSCIWDQDHHSQVIHEKYKEKQPAAEVPNEKFSEKYKKIKLFASTRWASSKKEIRTNKPCRRNQVLLFY